MAPATPVTDLSFLPPDLVIVVCTMFALQLCEVSHRKWIGPFFSSYSSLPYRDRFDWDRRVLNVSFQALQAVFNGYLLLFDPEVIVDPLYGYSATAHVGFLVIIAFYVYDATGIIMHPAPPSTSSMWVFHHFVAVGLLLFDVSFRRCSAFPAAVFLISGAGHIANEARWLCTAMNVQNQTVLKGLHVLCIVICVLTCVLPPPLLLVKGAEQLGVSVFDLVTTRMRSYCTFFFSLIYIPHVVLIFDQAGRAYRSWGLAPKPFRPKKVD